MSYMYYSKLQKLYYFQLDDIIIVYLPFSVSMVKNLQLFIPLWSERKE